MILETQITQLLSLINSLFITLLIFYSLIKIIRTAILSTNRWINLDDLNILIIASIFFSLIVSQPFNIIKNVIFSILITYWLLLWIDAIIFYLYSFEINRQNILEFLRDSRSMLHYSSRSFELFKRYPWIIFAFPLSVVAIYAPFFGMFNMPTLSVVLPTILAISIFNLQKFKQSISRNVLILSTIVFVVISFSRNIIQHIEYLELGLSKTFFLLTATSIIVLNIIRRKRNNTFFNLNSHFRNFLREDKIKINQNIKFKTEHQKLLNVSKYEFTPSKYFGALNGSNIILITAESVGSTYLSKNLHLPFLAKISEKSVVSKNHYAISPHTNQFLLHLFNSNYTPIYKHQLHQSLVNANYSTLFVSSANLNICESRELLIKIGFNKIVDKNHLYNINKKKGDYMLFDSIPLIVEELKNAPSFIQILTVQSHYPYDVIDKKKFDPNLLSDLKAKYLNTVEETDYIIDRMFSELSKEVSLDDTLIIYVGDHGESFGQLGYKAHANSTINAQLKVPFFIKHKALGPEIVQFSTHFDIIPTILDLLGIEYNNSIGSSIFSENRELPVLYYSMVRKGNAPANVKIKTKNEDIMIDRVLDYSIVVDENDQILRHLSDEEEIYYNTLMYRLLNKYNLIDS